MTAAKLAEEAMIAQAVTAARHFVSDKSSVVPSSYDRVIVALADARDAMAAENARLREALADATGLLGRVIAVRDRLADQNARLVALLREESAGQECSRMGGAGECGWNVPGLEPIPPCWACRRDALLAEIKVGA